jgi:nucleotide-binding universal stress UspA family protein
MPAVLLVPLDGSELSKRALPYAVTLAQSQPAGLMLMRVLEPKAAPGVPLLQEPAAVEQLEQLARPVRANGVDVETVVSSTLKASVAEAIAKVAHERGCRFIVMSTHGRGGQDRWVHGSIAEDVLSHWRAPVLLVPATCDRRWPTGTPLRVLVPLDGSAMADEVIEPLLDNVRAASGEVILLRVLPPPSAEAAAYLLEDRRTEVIEARRSPECAAERLRGSGLIVRIETTSGPPTAAIIDRVAHEENVDLIAMATHGRSGVPRIGLGSVATDTVRRAEVPLLPRAERRMFLDTRARALEGLNVSTRVEVQLGNEEVEECIAGVARQINANILVVVSGRTASASSVVLGSFAQGILRLSPCPVVLVKPG